MGRKGWILLAVCVAAVVVGTIFYVRSGHDGTGGPEGPTAGSTLLRLCRSSRPALLKHPKPRPPNLPRLRES